MKITLGMAIASNKVTREMSTQVNMSCCHCNLTPNPRSPIRNLPVEMWLKIINYLNFHDLAELRGVSTEL